MSVGLPVAGIGDGKLWLGAGDAADVSMGARDSWHWWGSASSDIVPQSLQSCCV